MTPRASLYHVGCAVRDIEEAILTLALFGSPSWTPVSQRDLLHDSPDGPCTSRLRLAYSRTAPHVELVQEVVGAGLWRTDQLLVLHHLGYWTDDLQGDDGRLTAAGHERVYAGLSRDHDRIERGVYYRIGNGPLVELVDSALRPAFNRLVRAAD